MLQKIFILLLSAATAANVLSSCRHRDIIPKEDMSRIYYDIYMTDQAVKDKMEFREMTDTLLLYEPIFNKYGYTSDDYRRSVDHYLLKPDKFEDIFQETKKMLEKRESQLKLILEAEGKRSRRWTVLDSLDIITADGIHSGTLYKTLKTLSFKPDTAVPCSPVPDTAFMDRPQNPFMVFTDSARLSDIRFTFYETPGFMEELRIIEENRRKAEEENKEETEMPEEKKLAVDNTSDRLMSRPDRSKRPVEILKTGKKTKLNKQQ